MKRHLTALALALTLCLTGCSSLLDRDYLHISPYTPVSSIGSAALQVDSYQGLVNAILYLVSSGTEQGVLNLRNYPNSVQNDLDRACLEVMQEDPLGAYAVESIRHDAAPMSTHWLIDLYISYRRTPEQIKSIVSVTGNSAIRRELSKTLAEFSPTATLRIGYFSQGEDYIPNLLRQAYYDTPMAAMGMPEFTICIYPDTGYQRIVELELIYPATPGTMQQRVQELEALTPSLVPQDATAESLYTSLHNTVVVDRTDAGCTAYDALIGGTANSEGAALAYQLLCDQAGIPCTVVCGQLDGAPHVWNIVSVNGSYRHLDLSAGLFGLTDAELVNAHNYTWDREQYPGYAPAPNT